MNVPIKPYLEIWGNERDWDWVEIVTLAYAANSPYTTMWMKKFLLVMHKNLRKNLRLREKLTFYTSSLLEKVVIWKTRDSSYYVIHAP